MLRKSAMYNLKVSTSLAPGGGLGGGLGGGPGAASGSGMGLLAVPGDPQGVTPRTPEILNSLMAMSHPLDSYPSTPNPSAAVPELNSPSEAAGSASGASPSRSPPSVQHTRSQLIKEGLKLTLQTKRRHTSGTSGASGASGASGDEDDDSPTSGKRVKRQELTPEDEERRRRRRERNKVAATKCRIKKRERTVNLVQESEILESQNYELKSQIQELETQRRRLVDMLATHTPSCTRPSSAQPSPQPQPPPPYDMYSYCPSPGPAPGPAPGSYGDVLMSQYCSGPGSVADTAAHGALSAAGENPTAPTGSPLEPLPPYYAVTKHEVDDAPCGVEPLLVGLEDHLDAMGGPMGYSYPHSMSMGVGAEGEAGMGAAHPAHHQQYGRPSSLALDTASSPSTPSSLDSPAHGGHGGHGAMVGIHQGLSGLPGHHYQHPQHGGMGLGMGGLTPLPLSPDGVFGMDSGCMA